MKSRIDYICLLIYFFSHLHHHVAADNLTDNLFIEGRSSFSFLVAHRPNLEGYPTRHFFMHQLNIGKKTSGQLYWHQLYHRPDMGVSLFYTDIGKNKYTGRALAALAFIQFPYIRFKHAQLNFKLALGPGWVEKKFDRINNYKNVVTGTHLNAAIQLTQSYEWQLTNHQLLSLGVCLTHFSNGAFKLPNLGINLAGIQLSYKYRFNNTEKTAEEQPLFNKKMTYILHYSAGLKQVYPVLGKQYFISNLAASALYQYHPKGSAGMSIDFFKDASVNNQMQFDTDSLNDVKTNLQIGLAAVYQVEIGKIAIPLSAGYYVYNNYKALPPVYLRFGVCYYITPQININFNLKSHYAKADFFSYGVGYKF
ncbi:MAG: acyloxyacyl hydrolase [Bacteroidota bacterium]